MKYVIIGGGPCGDSAVKELRKNDPTGEITLITEENYPPYRRLSLTKQAWTMPFEKISLNTEKQNINIVKNKKVVDINSENKEIICDDNSVFNYDKLLIATGISPRKLPYEGLIYLRTYTDFENMKKSLEKGKRVLVIGAGFTGLELSSQLKNIGCEVTVAYMEDIPCTRILPLDFCKEIVETFKNNGIIMLNNDTAETITYENEFKVMTKQGQELAFDLIVASVGNLVNNPFGDKVATENGIIVNKYLETSIKDVYCAGDCAYFPSDLFGIKMRKEFMDNAMKSGKCAALNMVGVPTVYNPIINTFFDAFDLGYKAVGEYGMNMDVSVKEVTGGKVIFYRQDNILKGIVFWKVKPALMPAIKSIEDKLTLSDEEYLYIFKYL